MKHGEHHRLCVFCVCPCVNHCPRGNEVARRASEYRSIVGSVPEWSVRQACNGAVSGWSAALTNTWICFTVAVRV